LVWYIIRRLCVAVVLVLAVGVLTRLVLHLLPGDPVVVLAGIERAQDPEVVKAIRASLGLDKPIYVQIAVWVWRLFRLDLGNTLATQQPVVDVIRDTLPRSLYIVAGGAMTGVLVGIPLGVTASLNRNRWLDWITSSVAALGISTPVFVVGTLLVLLLGVKLRWFPTSGYVDFSEDPGDFLRRLTLPVATLGFGMMAFVTRMTRSTMLEVMNQDYVRTARSKGLMESRVVYKHALRNALVPVVSLVGVELGTLLGRTVVVEYIFNWPGLGTMLLWAISLRDYMLAQGIVVIISVLFILINLLTDLAYGYLNPRIRYA